MLNHGETKKDLQDKLSEQGFKIGWTTQFKNLNGRQS